MICAFAILGFSFLLTALEFPFAWKQTDDPVMDTILICQALNFFSAALLTKKIEDASQ